jgi:hypothetical protein
MLIPLFFHCAFKMSRDLIQKHNSDILFSSYLFFNGIKIKLIKNQAFTGSLINPNLIIINEFLISQTG